MDVTAAGAALRVVLARALAPIDLGSRRNAWSAAVEALATRREREEVAAFLAGPAGGGATTG